MNLKKIKKKLRLKQSLMEDAGIYFEGLADNVEPARFCKAKSFERKSVKSYMKDYKKALIEIDKMFNEDNNTAVAEAKYNQTKNADKLSSSAEDRKEDNSPSPANDALKA